MNLRVVSKYLGYLLWTEAVFMLLCSPVGLLYGEIAAFKAMISGAGITALFGVILYLIGKEKNEKIYSREGFAVAGIGWILMSCFGALPFCIAGEIPHFVDAVFEVISGYTTTGASIVRDVEAMSHGLLFWRSFTHWLGGVGVLVFVLAIVSSQRGAGYTFHLLRAESAGPQVGKLLPRMKDSTRIIYLIYMGLSVINLLFLLAGGMPLFDALCTMFGTAGTGGFGIKADSMGSYSPYIQNVTTVFLLLFGANLSLYFLLLRREWAAVYKDEELRLYGAVVFVSVAFISILVWLEGMLPLGQSIHHSAFTVASVISTAGFSTIDFALWPQATRAVLLILMILGPMAGSTGGGIKTSRLLILGKSIKTGLYRLLHPRSVKAITINGKVLPDEVLKGVTLYFGVYFAVVALSFVLVSLDGFSMETNISAVLSCMNNIGPGLAEVGPAASYANYSYFSKIILSLDMLLGRLEIFPVLFLFMPAMWRKKA